MSVLPTDERWTYRQGLHSQRDAMICADPGDARKKSALTQPQKQLFAV